MAYTPAPFNPTTPYQNQVATELTTANNNFTILGQAFFNNDPTSQPILRASYIGSTAPTNPVAGTTWLDTSTTPPTLKVYDGSNWQSNVVNSTNAVNSNNADTVDSFHASQTPAPNTIPVANNLGVIDGGWLSASISSWRKIAEVNVVSDVDYVDFTGLNINTDKVYVLFAVIKNPTSASGSLKLYVENDTTDTNYYTQRMYAGGTSALASRDNVGYIGVSSGNDVGAGFSVIMKTPTNIPTWTSHWNRNIGSSIEIISASACCISPKSNITTIRIKGTTSGGIGAGSYFLLCSPYRQ
jgi:hypothetical protein